MNKSKIDNKSAIYTYNIGALDGSLFTKKY